MSQKQMYLTPRGKDEREVEYPPEYNEKQIRTLKRIGTKFINWNGIMMALGLGMSPHFFNAMKNKLKDVESVIMAIVAGPGKGKSWFALRLAEIFDPDFNPYLQIIFRRRQFLDIITGRVKLKFGQVVIIDEAHMSMGARNWGEKEQIEFVEQVAAMRSLGLIVIIVALHLEMLDKIIREFTLTYEVHMVNPGVATTYERNHPRWSRSQYPTKIATIDIQIPGKDDCPNPRCLRCDDRFSCGSLRAIYERIKKEFITNRADASTKKIDEKEIEPISNLDLLLEFHKYSSHIDLSTHGKIKPESLRYIDDKFLQLNLKTDRLRYIAYLFGKEYPEILALKNQKNP